MRCPDFDSVLDGDPSVGVHLAECSECRALHEATAAFREAFSPPVAVGEELILRTQGAIREVDAEDRRRSMGAAGASFILAGMTATPVVLAGLAGAEGGGQGLLRAIVMIVASAAVVVALEPRVARG